MSQKTLVNKTLVNKTLVNKTLVNKTLVRKNLSEKTWLKPFHPNIVCTIPIPVEFDRSMSVDMRVSSKRGIVEVESEPSWVASFIERVDQRLDANERRIEHRMDERLDANARRIEQVLGLHQTRLDKHDAELSSQTSVGYWSIQKKWCRREPTIWRLVFGNLVHCWLFKLPCPGRMVSETVLVRGWAPFG